MTRQRSAIVLVLVPALVSVLVTLLVLTISNRQRGTQERVILLPTYSSTAQIPPRDTLPPPESGSVGDGQPVVVVTEEGPPAASPPCENPIHSVDSGEVLGTIADSYQVSIEDLIATNLQLAPEFNPDFLSIGQQLVIPVCGIPEPTPTDEPTNTPVATRNIPAPISTATQAPAGAIVVTISRVLNPGDITSEAVEILNEGSPVDLGGWTISDRRGHTFEFPSFRLFSGGGVTIYTGVGENTPIDLYWGLDEAVWSVGETVTLRDDSNDLQDEFTVEQN